MAKILAVSDIHIHDYPQRNPTEKYRLYQTRLVAQNIIEVGKREGADIIVMAGDILEKSVVRPYIQAEAKLFLDTVMSNFREGYIIWGNHDEDSRHQDQYFNDACLSVMLPGNLHYSDGGIIEIGSSTVAFSNWKPVFDLSWIKKKVDVLFTHATICYSDTQEGFKSQVLDDTKFDLAICGDIHKPAMKGKFVSIGVPQRCKMGDSEEASGVIYDTETHKWDWVNLDPHQNLLKFAYTPYPEREGFHEDTGTWEVYKPDNVSITGNSVKDIKVPAWEEIGHLIDEIIKINGLEEIHSEVLANLGNPSEGEVDFGFTLTKFYCKNWRSIDEITIYFNEGDKILVCGKNGAGKSSILSALKYAFTENRFLKDYIQFGASECLTEIEFIYQGKMIKLRRGTKQYGLWVDGKECTYGNKKEFEEDMHKRFPFIDYMDVFFFDEDHLKFIGDIAPERKSEIVSKFFRLDRIDNFYQVSQNLLTRIKKSNQNLQDSYDSNLKVLDFISQKLNSISVPKISEEDALLKKKKGIELQENYKRYQEYRSKMSSYEASKKAHLDSIQNSERYLLELRKTREELGNIDLVNSGLKRLRELESEILGREKERGLLKQEIKKIGDEGSGYWNSYKSLEASICPVCGQKINESQVEDYKKGLQDKMNALLLKKSEIDAKLKEYDSSSDEHGITETRGEIKTLEEKRDQILRIESSILSYQEIGKKASSDLDNIRKIISSCQEIPEVILPDTFLAGMSEIENILNTWKEYRSLVADYNRIYNDLENIKKELGKYKGHIEDLDRYGKLTSTTGKIYEEIMSRLAIEFSDNQVKYQVESYNFRKKDHLDLASYYNNTSLGQWVSYRSASSGQKTILDINFLSKIITRLGLLVMDEFLKSLDPENHDICIDMISGMNVGCVLLSSHMESVAKFNNKTMSLELNDSGRTKVNLE